jgi:hypothetical protein
MNWFLDHLWGGSMAIVTGVWAILKGIWFIVLGFLPIIIGVALFFVVKYLKKHYH